MRKFFCFALLACSLGLFAVGCEGGTDAPPADGASGTDEGAHDHEHEEGEEHDDTEEGVEG